MATNFSFKMFKVIRSLSKSPTNRVLLPTVCVACGSAALYFSSVHRNENSMFSRFIQPKVAYAASANAAVNSPKVVEVDPCQSTREKRFFEFASVEVNGEYYMTPQDFLESVTEPSPRPRIGRMKLSENEVKSMLWKTPDRKKNSSRFFRSLHDKGLISYTEYLFFLCILTKPRAGFHIAFNMFDADGNQKVDKREFMVLGEIFRKRTESSCVHQAIQQNQDAAQDTTILVHLFGRKGKNDIYYEDFYRFMDNLQTEVLEMEFLAYSHGMLTISEEDFARMLLKYTDVADTEEYINTLRKRMPQEKGITFEEFRSFFQFINNLEDFAIAMQMYTLAGRSIGQDEFKRAVKISTGHELSEHLVDTVFKLFDKDGDQRLSQLEFMGVMKERIQRGFKRSHTQGHGWVGFQKCLRYNVKSSASH